MPASQGNSAHQIEVDAGHVKDRPHRLPRDVMAYPQSTAVVVDADGAMHFPRSLLYDILPTFWYLPSVLVLPSPSIYTERTRSLRFFCITLVP